MVFGQSPQDWHDWVNSGALAAFAVFVCWVSMRVVTHGGRKLFEFGERYIASTETLHDSLKEAEVNRTELCCRHAGGLEGVVSEVATSNQHLERLVQIYEEPGGPVTESIEAIHSANCAARQIKQAALEACAMCRKIAEAELPGSAEAVGRHCDAIEKIFNETR